jgi:hypothetical protein
MPTSFFAYKKPAAASFNLGLKNEQAARRPRPTRRLLSDATRRRDLTLTASIRHPAKQLNAA